MSQAAPPAIDAHPHVATKPLLRGWMHLLWFEFSLVAGTLTVVHAPADYRVPIVIYAAAVCALFGTSALYHRGTWRPAQRAVLQRLDHAMIFVLIAGSTTPIFVITIHGAASTALLTVLWTLTMSALVTHLFWMHAPELLVGSTFVGLGLLGVVALPSVWTTSGATASMLIAVGGALYIAGAVIFQVRKPNPWPKVFGYHEVFHTFVCAGATLHYVAIACLIV